MEGGGESDEIGREAHHGGAVQSGGEHKDSTDGDEDGKFQVQVYYYILVHFWGRIKLCTCFCPVLTSFRHGSSQDGGSSWLMLGLELLWPLASWILATVSSLFFLLRAAYRLDTLFHRRENNYQGGKACFWCMIWQWKLTCKLELTSSMR